MWNFRSILDYRKLIKNDPFLEEHLKEAKELWQISYTSKDVVYYMLALTVALVGFSLWWIKDTWNQVSSYQEQQQLVFLKLQHQPALSQSHLGAQRLFGVPLVEQGTISLSYTIQGILYDEEVDKRQVILKDDSGHTESYRVGERLPQGGRITRIDMDQIEVEAQGVRQKLKLPEYPASFLSKEPLNSNNSIFDDVN